MTDQEAAENMVLCLQAIIARDRGWISPEQEAWAIEQFTVPNDKGKHARRGDFLLTIRDYCSPILRIAHEKGATEGDNADQ